MIRHCVFVRFSATLSSAERQSIFAAIEALRDVIDGMGATHHGANASPEGLGKGFDDGFTIDFRDAAARDAYLAHPRHQAAGAALVAAVEGGLEGIIVFDLAIA